MFRINQDTYIECYLSISYEMFVLAVEHKWALNDVCTVLYTLIAVNRNLEDELKIAPQLLNYNFIDIIQINDIIRN